MNIGESNRTKLFQPFGRIWIEPLVEEKRDPNINSERRFPNFVVERRLMELMNGKIGIENEPGIGTTFWIELPCVEGNADPVSLS